LKTDKNSVLNSWVIKPINEADEQNCNQVYNRAVPLNSTDPKESYLLNLVWTKDMRLSVRSCQILQYLNPDANSDFLIYYFSHINTRTRYYLYKK